MERSTCQVQNVEDESMMTITTDWFEENIKITILRLGMVPLTGQQTTITQLIELLRNVLPRLVRYKIPREQYVTDLKKELSGKEKEAHFTLKDGKLSWKKNIWRKGMIEVKPIVDILALADISLEWQNDLAKFQDWSSRQNEELERRKKIMYELVGKLKDMEATKGNMEDRLYEQFLPVLHTKKRKIRELKEKLKNQQNCDNNQSIYDNETDKSDDEEFGQSSRCSRTLQEKRLRLSSPNKVDKEDASTSKMETGIKFSPESEDDIVLKFLDSQECEKKVIAEEDSDRDLFSQ